MQLIFNFAWRFLVIMALLALLTGVWIVADGLNDQTGPTDLAVVLGNAVLPNGQPGPVLRERLEVAVKRYRQNQFPLIVVSGGTHLDGYDEAARMAAYLIALGVPASAILLDRNGDNTEATARNLARLMRERNLHSATIITHYYHITRTKFLLQQYGIHQIQHVHVGLVQLEWGSAGNLAREVLALYYYLGKYYIPLARQSVESHLKNGLSSRL